MQAGLLPGVQGEVDFKTAPWPSISSEAKDCVKKLLTMNAKHRPTADRILQACPSYPPACIYMAA